MGSVFGPIVYTCLFLPASNHQKTLFRYDLQYKANYSKETLRESNMYTRILSLNHIELGYLVKQVEPDEVSNIIQSEAED